MIWFFLSPHIIPFSLESDCFFKKISPFFYCVDRVGFVFLFPYFCHFSGSDRFSFSFFFPVFSSGFFDWTDLVIWFDFFTASHINPSLESDIFFIYFALFLPRRRSRIHFSFSPFYSGSGRFGYSFLFRFFFAPVFGIGLICFFSFFRPVFSVWFFFSFSGFSSPVFFDRTDLVFFLSSVRFFSLGFLDGRWKYLLFFK